jgi:hypothetical protein
LNGIAATQPVSGDVTRYSCPARCEKPDAMYSCSNGDNLRLAETHSACARNASNISPAKICGWPILNSFTAWNMNCHLYHATL